MPIDDPRSLATLKKQRSPTPPPMPSLLHYQPRAS
jgi:hypothetical protein